MKILIHNTKVKNPNGNFVVANLLYLRIESNWEWFGSPPQNWVDQFETTKFFITNHCPIGNKVRINLVGRQSMCFDTRIYTCSKNWSHLMVKSLDNAVYMTLLFDVANRLIDSGTFIEINNTTKKYADIQ